MKRADAAANSPIIFDADIARMFGISVRTLQRRLIKPQVGELDLNEARPEVVGGRRFWLRERVMRLLGVGS